ncbi:MAG: polysaccharide deacetylase family protein [Gammaproteobacteria bacterium]|nr:polysaccharide deacetylase family protein [Gammaproteobacteria bacterium]NNM00745.1 polysaccharide deacetylase family protein [Gammaproteobacteria bacterium]
MTLDRDYFEYPRRGPGMDHDFYEFSMLERRDPVTWPGGARVALWVNVGLQFFPLNQAGKPFPPPGGMTTAYPDLRHFTLREYGNRVGIFRFLKAFDRLGIKATFALNCALAERCPYLVRRLVERGDEISCHGLDMDSPHYGGMDRDEENKLVARSLGTLRSLTGQPVSGWISPGKSQSMHTPALLVEHGVEYMCDWINDDMPYCFTTPAGPITAMPLSLELEDRFIIMNNLHSEAEYTQQICDAFDFLYAEAAEQGGRMLALSIHPWMLGQPHRIGALEAALIYIMGHAGVWSAGAGEICRAAQAAA